MRFSILLLCLLGFVLPAHAQPSLFLFPPDATASAAVTSPSESPGSGTLDYGAFNLEALLDAEVDTGSGFRQKLSEIPAVVEVLTREDIQRLGVRDLNELLWRLAGVFLQPSIHESIIAHPSQLRGGGVGDKILVMLDDHSMLDELDDTYAPYSIPIESIERVEFVRGPAAVLYGSSALAGVLRIKTRQGERLGAGSTLLADPLGQSGELSAAGYYADPKNGEGLRLRADVTARKTDPILMFVPADAAGDSGFFPRQVTYLTAMATLRWQNFYLRTHNHILNTRVMGLQPQISWRTGLSELQYHGAELGYSRKTGNWVLKTRAALDMRKRSIDFGLFPPFSFGGRHGEDLRTKLDFDGLVAEVATSAGYEREDWSLIGGLQYRHLRSTNFGFHYEDGSSHPLFPPDDLEAFIDDGSLFVQGSYSPQQALTLLAGLRGSYYDRRTAHYTDLPAELRDPKPEVAPMGRAAVVWKPWEKVTFKALYGRALRLPSMFESYAMVRGIVAPAPDLKPEVQDTAELALDVKPVTELFWRINGYYNRVAGSIEVGDNPIEGEAIRYSNQKQFYSTYGFDTTLQWVPYNWVNIFGSYTLQRGKWEDGRYLNGIPPFVAKGGATAWALERRLTVTPFVWVVGPYYGDKRYTWPVSLALRWQAWEPVALLASADNVFNTRVFQPYYAGLGNPPIHGFIQDGRTARVGVAAEF